MLPGVFFLGAVFLISLLGGMILGEYQQKKYQLGLQKDGGEYKNKKYHLGSYKEIVMIRIKNWMVSSELENNQFLS